MTRSPQHLLARQLWNACGTPLRLCAACLALSFACGRYELGALDADALGGASGHNESRHGGSRNNGGRSASSGGRGRTQGDAATGGVVSEGANGGAVATGGERAASGGSGALDAGGAGGVSQIVGGASGATNTAGEGGAGASAGDFGGCAGDENGGAGGGAGESGAGAAPSPAGGAQSSHLQRSCSQSDPPCGTEQESCCTRRAVPSGHFIYGERDVGVAVSSQVSGFWLDRYEVTVARFQSFLEAYDAFRASGAPAPGAGAHPLIPGSGWNPRWELAPDEEHPDEALGSDRATVEAAVNDCMGMPLSNVMSIQPVNCVSWFEAQAFCIWDGGRLPTELEWEYAAAGGEQNRRYPWGDSAPTHGDAFYDCQAILPQLPCLVPPVGSLPAGEARWGQLDMAGSVWEWTFDVFSTLPRRVPCNDCADVRELYIGNPRGVRGGGWESEAEWLQVDARHGLPAGIRLPYQGFRCAYDLEPRSGSVEAQPE